jgi:peptidoglycan hydrolase-like protein with peptidoglycan-binding domain
MISREASIREAPARRGHRLLALATAIVFAASLLLVARASTAWAASGSPQSSNKSSSKKSSSASKKNKKGRRHWEPIQKAPTTDRIEEIQTALAREGYYHGDPTKKWDSNTQDAMRKFQEDHGMTGTGKLDATTLQKLGLGSDIAGVSAPRPVQHPTGTPTPASPPPATPSSSASTDPGGL